MSIKKIEDLLSKGNFDSILKTMVTNNQINEFNSLEFQIRRFQSLLNGGYYVTLRNELENFILTSERIPIKEQIEILFLKCEIINNLSEDKKGILIVDQIYSLILKNNIQLKEKDFLNFKNGIYKLLFCPFDQIFDQYLNNSKYFSSIISQIDSFKNFLPQYYLKMGIVLRKRHDLSNSIAYLNKALDFSSNNKYIIAEIHFQLGLTNIAGQFFDQAIQNFDISIQLLKELNNSNKLIESIIFLSGCYLRNGDLNLAEDLILRSIHINKPIFEDLYSIMLFEQLGDIYFFKGELKNAYFNCYLVAEKKYDEFKLTKNQSNLYIKIARLKASEGSFEDSKLYINKTIQNYKEEGDFDYMNMAKSFLGNAFFEMGDYETAFDLWLKVDKYFQEVKIKRFIAFNNLNIGKYFLISNNIQSISYYKQTITIFEELHLIEGEIESYLGYSIALEEFEPDQIDEERSIFYKTKNLITNLKGNYLYINEAIYRLCLLSIENLLGHTRSYIDLTLNLLEKIPLNNRIAQKIKFLQAVKLKSTIRLKDQTKSLELFEEIVKDELMDYQTTLLSYLYLLEFKIFELKFSDNSEILEEANEILENLIKLTSTNKSSAWLAKTLALKSQMNLLEMDFDEAKRNINKALNIAKNKQMKSLLKHLNTQYDDLLSKITKLRLLDSNNDSISSRLEITDFLVFDKNRSEFLEISDEQPAYISLLDSSGMSLYSFNFLSTQSENFDQLMSGFLSAINSVISKLFSVSGFIERIKHKEYTIMIFHLMNEFYICYAFKGPSYHAQEKMDLIQSELQQKGLMNSVIEASLRRRTLNKNEIDMIEFILKKFFPL